MSDAPEELQQPEPVEIRDGARTDGQPIIGLAIIVKDESATLGRLLDSVGFTADEPDVERSSPAGEVRGIWRPEAAVDYVVVCDTGSTDETKMIAAARGCDVVEFDWVDDFGKARQASYDALPDEVHFTLWADADDVIEGAELLRQLAARMPAEVGGTIHRYDYAQDDAGNSVCELWRERLVRRGIGERWKLPIHEILEVPAPLMHVEEVVWHHRQPEGRKRDVERNYRILKASADEQTAKGEDVEPRTLAYLGTETLALGKPDEAVPYFREYLDSESGWAEERCQVAHKLSVALRQLANKARAEGAEDLALELIEESAQAAFRAQQERPDWADGYLDLAEIALDREQPEQALYYCGVAERLEPPRTILIINPLEYSYQPIVMRSVALAKLGRDDEAFAETQKALAITPYRSDLLGQASMLARKVKGGEAVKAFLTLREILVRHDENEKARILTDNCAPYFVWDRPEVAAARLDQREMTLHSTDPDVYASYYRDNPGEAPFELQGVPIPDAHKAFLRVQFLRDGLTEQATGDGVREARGETNGVNEAVADLRILDLSMNDGWMLANLASAGYGAGAEGTLDGMDLNSGAVERANGRCEDYPALGQLLEGNLFEAPERFEPHSYDAVACFETIEHVPDPAALIDLMLQMVKPTGRIYVSTPDGAYEQGNLPDWARVESKGHLRAMRPVELCKLLCSRGIVRDFAREQSLMTAALEPAPRQGKVIFYAAGAEAAPEKILDGLGGSETALVKMAEGFARQGYDVRVYTGPPGVDKAAGLRGDHLTVEEPVVTGQILYAPATEWDPGEACDLFVSVRVPEAFDRTVKAERRVLWLHDADYGDRLTAKRIERTTDVVVMSHFQADLLREKYPDEDPARGSILGRSNLFISRNGIEPRYFEDPADERKPIVAFTSSPDRGLDVLLECWPQIRERAEAAGVEAELHHAYAPVYAAMRDRFPHLQAFHRRIEKLTAEAGEGVVNLGHLSQPEVAALYSTARCWAYPSWTTPLNEPFPEISCITAMEAQAGGAIPVALDFGALRETVLDRDQLIAPMTAGDPPRLNTAWREAFVDAVVDVLANPEHYEDSRRDARIRALGLGWDGVVADWLQAFLGREARDLAPVEVAGPAGP